MKSGVTTKELKHKLDQFKVCQRHVGVCRSHAFGVNNSEFPGHVLGLDFVVLMDGVYLLVKVDYFTICVQVDLCDTADAKQVIKGLERWLQAKGKMHIIRTG